MTWYNGLRARRHAFLAGLLLAFVCAGPASASPETLKRSVSNILFGPFDVAFSPVVAAQSIYYNLHDIDDSPGVRAAYTIPGFIWNTGVQVGAGTIRVVAGVIELLPGLGLLFFETDLDPIFPPVENQDAIVDVETPVIWVKFGVNYTT